MSDVVEIGGQPCEVLGEKIPEPVEDVWWALDEVARKVREKEGSTQREYLEAVCAWARDTHRVVLTIGEADILDEEVREVYLRKKKDARTRRESLLT